MKWGRFLAAITPDLVGLAKVLFDRFGGDLARARSEIALIRNHGERLDPVRAEVDRELAALRGGPR